MSDARPRYATPRTPGRASLGAQVAAAAEALGQPLMPWQRDVVDVGLELLPNGKPAYREVVVTVPRQSGKTWMLLAVECQRALGWGRRQRIAYTAQSGLDARKKLIDDQAPILEKSALNVAVKRIYKAAGSESIDFVNGSRIAVINNSESAGHGATIDLGIIDEAFADIDNRREQAMGPAMITKPDAQLWIISTAGTEDSIYLNRKIQAGRTAVAEGWTEGICFTEWSADPNDDPGDEEAWQRCMPALGRTIGIEAIRHEYEKALAEDKLGEFSRAYLNLQTATDERVIPASMWAKIAKPDLQPFGDLVLGLDASVDRSWASIVAVDSQLRGELVDHGEGVGWLLERVQEIRSKHDDAAEAPVVVDERGPLAVLIPELQALGIPTVGLNSTEMAQACAGLYDKIADEEISVCASSALDQAAAAVTRRTSGDVWVWGRKDARTDVSPLVALTVAVHVAERRNRGVDPEAWWG